MTLGYRTEVDHNRAIRGLNNRVESSKRLADKVDLFDSCYLTGPMVKGLFDC